MAYDAQGNWIPDPIPGVAPPAPMAGGSPIQIVAPPAETSRVSTEGPVTTTTAPTPEAKAKLDEVSAANTKRIEAANTVAAGAGPAAVAEADAAQKAADLEQRLQLQREQAQREAAERAKAAQAETQKARMAAEKAANPSSFWEDRGGTPARILSAFLVGLAEFGSGRNKAYEILKDAMASDRQAKLDAYTKSKEFLEIAKQGEAAVQSALADKLAEINGNGISQMRTMTAAATALAKRTGIPQAVAAAEELAAKVTADVRMDEAKELGHLTKKGAQTTTSHTVNTPGGDAGGAKPDPLQIPGWEGGVLGRANTPQEAIKIRDAHAAGHSLVDLVDELNNHVKEAGVILNPLTQAQEIQRRDGIVSQLAGKLTIANQTGTLQAGEFERYKAMTKPGFLQALSPDDLGKAMDQLKKDAQRGYGRMAQSQGVSSAPQAAPSPAKPAANPKKVRDDIRRFRAFLDSSEAKANPEKAKTVREILKGLEASSGN